MKVPNSIPQDLYNKFTYSKTIGKVAIDEMKLHRTSEDSPLWVTGMFRSGTSFVTRLLAAMGMDLGPQEDQLLPKGSRAQLNPDGFHENFLFMEWSLMVFSELKSWGDNPPTMEALQNFENSTIDYEKFVYNAIVNIHDDRISNKNKSRILRRYYSGNLTQYVQDQFNDNPIIKNPHFCLLFPVLDQIFPKGKYLVVFRHPSKTIASAKQITPNADFNLYEKYYKEILKHPHAQFLDLDALIAHPIESITKLQKALNLTGDIEQLAGMVKPNTANNLEELPKNIKTIYDQLQANSINKL